MIDEVLLILVLPILPFFLRRDINANNPPIPTNAATPPPSANALSSRKLEAGGGGGGGAAFLGGTGFASAATATVSVFGAPTFASADFASTFAASLVASVAPATDGVTCATLTSAGEATVATGGAGLTSAFGAVLSSTLAASFASAGAPRPFTSASFFIVVICFSRSVTREFASFNAFSRAIFSSLAAFA